MITRHSLGVFVAALVAAWAVYLALVAAGEAAVRDLPVHAGETTDPVLFQP